MESKTVKRSGALTGLIAAAATVLLTVAVTATAQQNTGTILGVVKDSSGSVVNEQSMSALPLNGINYVHLTMLLPGVSPQTFATKGGTASATGARFSANGAPVRSNYLTLDGAPMVNAGGAAAASEAGTTLGVDGIREYKVVTSAFSAEYGMAMGSQTVMVSKNGTNLWHGDVFEYIRNSALDARNFFDYRTS